MSWIRKKLQDRRWKKNFAGNVAFNSPELLRVSNPHNFYSDTKRIARAITSIGTSNTIPIINAIGKTPGRLRLRIG